MSAFGHMTEIEQLEHAADRGRVVRTLRSDRLQDEWRPRRWVCDTTITPSKRPDRSGPFAPCSPGDQDGESTPFRFVRGLRLDAEAQRRSYRDAAYIPGLFVAADPG